uniref:Uncharacterized protein n=1 Tax=Steinernema glaseri TaxID=37863 RepID=A0A1I7YAA1_9BILA
MRAAIGLLTSLLLLCWSPLVTASYKNVIACGTYREAQKVPPSMQPFADLWVPRVLRAAFKWSPEKSSFVELENNNPPTSLFGLGQETTFNDCGYAAVKEMCRTAYDPRFSHVVTLNKTKSLLACTAYCKDVFILPSVPEEKGPVEVQLFKCQGDIHTKEPEVPEGSWSDRLTTLDFPFMGRCKYEDYWLKESIKFCGRKPTNYVFGAQCGGARKYNEIIFVCDQPKKRVVNDKYDTLPQLQNNDVHKTFFRRLVEIVERFQEAKSRNESDAVERYTSDLHQAYEMAYTEDVIFIAIKENNNQVLRVNDALYINEPYLSASVSVLYALLFTTLQFQKN